jgi:hypothetical protein
MLVCTGIITQPIELQANKNCCSPIMHGNYAGFAQSVVAIVEFFARQARYSSRHWRRQQGSNALSDQKVLGFTPQPLRCRCIRG